MNTRLTRFVVPIIVVAFGALVGVAKSADTASVWRSLPCDASAEFYRDGHVRRCTLVSDFRLGAHELPAGSRVSVTADARLASVSLSREAPIFGEPLPANTTLIFVHGGELRSFWLAADTTIQGHLLAAQRDGFGNTLYQTGKLRAVGLAQDETIDNVPCTSRRNPFQLGLSAFVNGDNARVVFHPNGRLRQCRVARSVSVGGHTFARGDVVHLRSDGTVDPSPDVKP